MNLYSFKTCLSYTMLLQFSSLSGLTVTASMTYSWPPTLLVIHQQHGPDGNIGNHNALKLEDMIGCMGSVASLLWCRSIFISWTTDPVVRYKAESLSLCAHRAERNPCSLLLTLRAPTIATTCPAVPSGLSRPARLASSSRAGKRNCSDI